MTQRITREIARGRERLQQQGQERFVAYLKGKPDDRLDRVLGSPPVLRAVFAGMAKSYQPDRAQGFQGSIQYELHGRRGVQRWAIQVAGRGAYPVKGFAHDAAVTLRMSIPTFAKIVTGDVDGARAFFEGKIQVEGDLAVAARLAEMFGGRSNF
jgi:putative sterol carrier protein